MRQLYTAVRESSSALQTQSAQTRLGHARQESARRRGGYERGARRGAGGQEIEERVLGLAVSVGFHGLMVSYGHL